MTSKKQGKPNIFVGSSFGLANATSSTVTYNQYGFPSLIDTLIKDDCIELVYRANPVFHYSNGMQPDPKIWKEVYRSVNGKIEKVETIDGKYIPELNRPEGYEFE